MTPAEYEDLMKNAPPEEGLEAKYEHLLHAFQEQERTMKGVAEELRFHSRYAETDTDANCLADMADELDPREPLAEADAAEKFSQDYAERKLK